MAGDRHHPPRCHHPTRHGPVTAASVHRSQRGAAEYRHKIKLPTQEVVASMRLATGRRLWNKHFGGGVDQDRPVRRRRASAG